ncbi:MAG TPA: GAF domain-containing protein [Terracidiphilus sp.]|jgi:GAF domain-containing protein
MADPRLATDRLALLDQFRKLAATSLSLEELQTKIVEAAAQRLPHFSWTGFYMLDPNNPNMLVLGPFVGAPTSHVRIPVNQGICGAAVESGQTVIIDDVGSDPRYLSCSIDTKSEIVAPIFAHGMVAGEIDIDSHDPAAFKEADRVFLEEVALIVGKYIEEHPAESFGRQSKLIRGS